jgi:hypothetical protein
MPRTITTVLVGVARRKWAKEIVRKAVVARDGAGGLAEWLQDTLLREGPTDGLQDGQDAEMLEMHHLEEQEAAMADVGAEGDAAGGAGGEGDAAPDVMLEGAAGDGHDHGDDDGDGDGDGDDGDGDGDGDDGDGDSGADMAGEVAAAPSVVRRWLGMLGRLRALRAFPSCGAGDGELPAAVGLAYRQVPAAAPQRCLLSASPPSGAATLTSLRLLSLGPFVVLVLSPADSFPPQHRNQRRCLCARSLADPCTVLRSREFSALTAGRQIGGLLVVAVSAGVVASGAAVADIADEIAAALFAPVPQASLTLHLKFNSPNTPVQLCCVSASKQGRSGRARG